MYIVHAKGLSLLGAAGPRIINILLEVVYLPQADPLQLQKLRFAQLVSQGEQVVLAERDLVDGGGMLNQGQVGQQDQADELWLELTREKRFLQ